MFFNETTKEFLQSVADLEEMLEDECLCESKHQGTSAPSCSILATHRVTVTCQKGSALICTALALANLEFMEDTKNHFCIYCHLPASGCWKVTLL